MTSYPIGADDQWSDPGKGFHIHTVAHLTQQGQLWVQVTTSTNSWGLGFTSGAMVVLVDAGGNKVDVSPLYSAGVDAKSVFWGRSTRVDNHIETFSTDVAARTTSLQLWMDHNPHDRWFTDWKKIKDGATEPIETVKGIWKSIFG